MNKKISIILIVLAIIVGSLCFLNKNDNKEIDETLAHNDDISGELSSDNDFTFEESNMSKGLMDIYIDTNGKALPTFEPSYHPDGCIGAGIKNNEYVEAYIDIKRNDEIITSQEMKFRVRGNTSAYSSKTPYLFKLSEKTDLFQRGNDKYKDKDYILLGEGNDIKLVAGLFLSKYFNIYWQPNYEFVNLYINNQYKGCYILIEKVENEEGRIKVDDSGYIFENDAYFWNEDGEYFKTPYQVESFGWTFKYPNMTEDNYLPLYNYLNEFEKLLMSGNEECLNYIDIDSFASWLIVNDLILPADAGGTNMYLYKYDFIENDKFSSKIAMATNWDFSQVFGDLENDAFGENVDNWSRIHFSYEFYYPELLQYNDFINKYLDIWNSKSNIREDIISYFEHFYETYGDFIQTAWDKEDVTYNTRTTSLYEQIEEMKQLLLSRVDFIENNKNCLTIFKRNDIKNFEIDNNTIKFTFNNGKNYSELHAEAYSWIDKENKNKYIMEENDANYETELNIGNYLSNERGFIHIDIYSGSKYIERIICIINK